jgi:hypothetical protein
MSWPGFFGCTEKACSGEQGSRADTGLITMWTQKGFPESIDIIKR